MNDKKTVLKNMITSYHIDINNTKRFSDYVIKDIKDDVYKYMDENGGSDKMDYILDKFINRIDIEGLITDRINNDGLYVLEKLKDVDLENEYFMLDGYDEIENIDYTDVLWWIEDILDELENL